MVVAEEEYATRWALHLKGTNAEWKIIFGVDESGEFLGVLWRWAHDVCTMHIVGERVERWQLSAEHTLLRTSRLAAQLGRVLRIMEVFDVKWSAFDQVLTALVSLHKMARDSGWLHKMTVEEFEQWATQGCNTRSVWHGIWREMAS
jgi:hypothetical protein